MTSTSLYVHVPFCRTKCAYCDFYSLPVAFNDAQLFNQYNKKLINDAQRLFDFAKPSLVPTLYIGGGTPSLLGAVEITYLICNLLKIINSYSPPPVEITLEVNPESIDEEFLDAVKRSGVTRLSLGIQSFYTPSREKVNRIGSDKLLHSALSMVSEYYKNSFSIDLISGLPLQNKKIILEDIDLSLSYSPVHVSLYALTVEESSPLFSSKDITFAAGDEADDLWLTGRDALIKAGLNQYEVSNFCTKGNESLHNIRYWQMRSWHALGPSASGTIIMGKDDAFRYTHPSDMELFNSNNNIYPNREIIGRNDLIKETMLMGFRYIEGPDAELFRKRFFKCIEDTIPVTLKKWNNFLQKDKIALKEEALLLLNPFLLDAFTELDSYT